MLNRDEQILNARQTGGEMPRSLWSQLQANKDKKDEEYMERMAESKRIGLSEEDLEFLQQQRVRLLDEIPEFFFFTVIAKGSLSISNECHYCSTFT